MNTLSTPRAIVIGAALIAGAILISNGVYEFYSPQKFIVHRYNKLTGNVYYCGLGEQCEPFEPAKDAESQEGVKREGRVLIDVPNKSEPRNLLDKE